MREHSRDKGSFERFYRHLYWSAVETNYWYAPVHSVVIVVSVVVKNKTSACLLTACHRQAEFE